MATLFAAEPGPAEISESLFDDGASTMRDAGVVLRRAREAAGYSLRDIAAVTRIAERLLAAIEASEFAAFRAPLYAIGFARTFARHVGVSELWVAASVRDRIARDRPTPPEEPVARRRGPSAMPRLRQRR